MYRSIRKKGWDYSQTADYLITICTKNRLPYFGSVEKGAVSLSPVGEIVQRTIFDIPEVHSNVILKEWVIMPDHIHLIIHFNRRLPKEQSGAGKFGPQKATLGRVIAGFKARVTSQALIENCDFEWQIGYHDRILNHQSAIENATRYIRENPQNL